MRAIRGKLGEEEERIGSVDNYGDRNEANGSSLAKPPREDSVSGAAKNESAFVRAGSESVVDSHTQLTTAGTSVD